MGPFEVSKDDVARFEDEPLRDLLRRLIEAQARKDGIDASAISVGGNQNTADGGVDARVDWYDGPEPRVWLPRRLTIFQSKATSMAPSEIASEMRPNDVARAIFGELGERKGAYIIFSSEDCSDAQVFRRREAMRTALTDVLGNEHIALDFYGADRIARWTNSHPGVLAWALECIGRPTSGWQPYGAWSTGGPGAGPYLLDDSERAFVSNNCMTISDAIGEIRTHLSRHGSSVRIVGLSGVGKTRLAEALFDPSVGEQALTPSCAIYGDASRTLTMNPARLAEQLALNGIDAILVVDNCAAVTHSELQQIVIRPGSRLSLLTIDYDVGDDQPRDTLIVRLDANTSQLIERLLEERRPDLAIVDRGRIAEFSTGNARIALTIAGTTERTESLARLSDAELINRLFQRGRQDSDPIHQRCAEAAALVYAFYVDTADGFEPEHPILALIAGVPAAEMYRALSAFLDWGIAQQRGPQRAIMPHALAIRLAGEAFRRRQPAVLVESFISGPPRLFTSFARRLGYLHHVTAAVEAARILFDPDGALGDPTVLSGTMVRAFRYCAPANPEGALRAIERALEGEHELEFRRSKYRREYAEVLAHLAYEQALFPRAMQALSSLASVEEQLKHDVRLLFLERFWLCLSFTQATLHQRLRVIDGLLASADIRERKLGVAALSYMLATSNFLSSFDVDFGSRPRGHEWRPEGADGRVEWYREAISRMATAATTADDIADDARSELADNMRGLLDAGYSHVIAEPIQRVRAASFWCAGWRAICEALSFNGSLHHGRDSQVVGALEAELRPRKLEETFEAFVLSEPWLLYRPKVHRPGAIKGFMRDVARLAKAVGRSSARDIGLLPQFARLSISSMGHTSCFQFGREIGAKVADLDEAWGIIEESFRAAPANQRNPQLVAGFLLGASKRAGNWAEQHLNAALDDPDLEPHTVALNCVQPLDGTALSRLTTAASRGRLQPSQFVVLASGRVTEKAAAAELVALLTAIMDLKGGTPVAATILHMRIFGDRLSKRSLDGPLMQFGRALLTSSKTYEEFTQYDGYHQLARLCRLCLLGPDAEVLAREICRAIKTATEHRHHVTRDLRDLCRVLVQRQLHVVLDEVASEIKTRHWLVSQFFDLGLDDSDPPLQKEVKLDVSAILAWISTDPERRTQIVACVVPYATLNEETSRLQWTPAALALFDLPTTDERVLQAFENRFHLGASSGRWSQRYVRRRALAEDLLHHPNGVVRGWAHGLVERLELWIADADRREPERENRFE